MAALHAFGVEAAAVVVELQLQAAFAVAGGDGDRACPRMPDGVGRQLEHHPLQRDGVLRQQIAARLLQLGLPAHCHLRLLQAAFDLVAQLPQQHRDVAVEGLGAVHEHAHVIDGGAYFA